MFVIRRVFAESAVLFVLMRLCIDQRAFEHTRLRLFLSLAGLTLFMAEFASVLVLLSTPGVTARKHQNYRRFCLPFCIAGRVSTGFVARFAARSMCDFITRVVGNFVTRIVSVHVGERASISICS